MNPEANAGWFGPGKSDIARVTVKSAKGKCDPGFYTFEVRNDSTYSINKVTFEVYGVINGHSTKYDLTFNSMPFESDVILSPGQFTVGCWRLNSDNWPQGERLAIYADVVLVDFKK